MYCVHQLKGSIIILEILCGNLVFKIQIMIIMSIFGRIRPMIGCRVVRIRWGCLGRTYERRTDRGPPAVGSTGTPYDAPPCVTYPQQH